MKPLYSRIFLLLCSLGAMHCGQGGTEAGNPFLDSTVGYISGTVDSATTTSLSKSVQAEKTNSNCAAETVVGTDSDQNTVSTNVESDCSFELQITLGREYRIHLTQDNTVVANMQFRTGSNVLQRYATRFSRGRRRFPMGRVRISGNIASPDTEPSTINDADHDGIVDFDDDDDDDNGTTDLNERDCDLDGFFSDDIDNGRCDSENLDLAEIITAIPGDDPSGNNPERHPPFDQIIAVQVECEVDTTTINSSNFTVSSNNHTISCTFTTLSHDRIVICAHPFDLFAPDTVYSATVSGLRCANGDTVEHRTWSWKTRHP